MAEAALTFDDSDAYERFVGQWGRAAGRLFLEWLRPPTNASWLDVGCGTGLFTQLVLTECAPASVIGIDQAQAQIDHARRKSVAGAVKFQVADAQALPFPDGAFDLVVSALVINFINDRLRALSEMRRVARADAIAGSYVWDFSNELSPSGPFRNGIRSVVTNLPLLPGTQESRSDALYVLFQRAGFEEIETVSFDVSVTFSDFESFWLAQTPSYAPTTKLLAGMTESELNRVVDAVKERLPSRSDGRIEYPARANAIKGVLG